LTPDLRKEKPLVAERQVPEERSAGFALVISGRARARTSDS
jgi:hypothetical protein